MAAVLSFADCSTLCVTWAVYHAFPMEIVHNGHHRRVRQLPAGTAGRYFIDGDRLVDADFTLDDVRRAAK